jgi:hypothetical protein
VELVKKPRERREFFCRGASEKPAVVGGELRENLSEAVRVF